MRNEKWHFAVARSAFASQDVQNMPFSAHFWKFRCRKMARPCGGKYMCKSKCTKHTILSPLLEVQMSQTCTLLWCEVHLQVKMNKHTILGPLLEVQMSKKCRTTFPTQNVLKHEGLLVLEVQMSRNGTLL